MWLLDRGRPGELLRIGRLAAEWWISSGPVWTLVQSIPLDAEAAAPGRLLQLTEALNSLQAVTRRRRVVVLLESCWAPVLLADTGGCLTATAEVRALVRHQFKRTYANDHEPVADWALRIDHRLGERFALGYAVSPGLQQCLRETVAGRGVERASVLPAFAWGMARWRPGGRSRRLPETHARWWLWTEQDRLIAARLKGGRVVGLNPGLPPIANAEQIGRLVNAEGRRLGFDAHLDAIRVAVWSAPPHACIPPPRLTWCCIPLGPKMAIEALTLTPQTAGVSA